jgi:predicted nucleic acid-binding protein
MGLILDSSVVIAAERRGETPSQFLEQIILTTGDQEAALTSVGLAELVHGIYRANTPQIQTRRAAFIDELRNAISVYPFTAETAMIAGRIDGEQTARGIIIPSTDLQIGAIASVTRLRRAHHKSKAL